MRNTLLVDIRRAGQIRTGVVVHSELVRDDLPGQHVIVRVEAIQPGTPEIALVALVVPRPDAKAGVVRSRFMTFSASSGQPAEELVLRVPCASHRKILPDQNTVLVAPVVK